LAPHAASARPEHALHRHRMARGDCWRTFPGPRAATRPSAAYTSWTSTTTRRRPACPSAAWRTSWSRAGPRRALRSAAAAPDRRCMPSPCRACQGPQPVAGLTALEHQGAPAPARSRAGSKTDWQWAPRQVPFTKAHVLAHPEYELMSMPHYFSANSAPWCAAVPTGCTWQIILKLHAHVKPCRQHLQADLQMLPACWLVFAGHRPCDVHGRPVMPRLPFNQRVWYWPRAVS